MRSYDNDDKIFLVEDITERQGVSMRKYGLICVWGLLFAVWLSGCSDQKNSAIAAVEMDKHAVIAVGEQGRQSVMGVKAVGKGNSSRYGL